jgi:hypothetical protein
LPKGTDQLSKFNTKVPSGAETLSCNFFRKPIYPTQYSDFWGLKQFKDSSQQPLKHHRLPFQVAIILANPKYA